MHIINFHWVALPHFKICTRNKFFKLIFFFLSISFCHVTNKGVFIYIEFLICFTLSFLWCSDTPSKQHDVLTTSLVFFSYRIFCCILEVWKILWSLAAIIYFSHTTFFYTFRIFETIKDAINNSKNNNNNKITLLKTYNNVNDDKFYTDIN